MIYFGIPLRSKATANDWDKVSLFFNRTLWSVYRQTDSDFRIIVACHDIPELVHDFDGRVEFIQVDFNKGIMENIDLPAGRNGKKAQDILLLI